MSRADLEAAAGAEWALPEEPDPAVIEAMAKAIKPLFLDCKVDLDAEDYAWDAAWDYAWDAAWAAYAALRGAMQ